MMHLVFSDLTFKQEQEELERLCRQRQKQGLYEAMTRQEQEAHGLIAWIVDRFFVGQTETAKPRRVS